VQSFENVTPVFLKALDRFLLAGGGDDHLWTGLTLNGRTIAVPLWPSDPDGAIVATFD
jgi:hypothetical protein